MQPTLNLVQCPFCRRYSNIRRSITRVAGSVGDIIRPVRCPYCDAVFRLMHTTSQYPTDFSRYSYVGGLPEVSEKSPIINAEKYRWNFKEGLINSFCPQCGSNHRTYLTMLSKHLNCHTADPMPIRTCLMASYRNRMSLALFVQCYPDIWRAVEFVFGEKDGEVIGGQCYRWDTFIIQHGQPLQIRVVSKATPGLVTDGMIMSLLHRNAAVEFYLRDVAPELPIYICRLCGWWYTEPLDCCMDFNMVVTIYNDVVLDFEPAVTEPTLFWLEREFDAPDL